MSKLQTYPVVTAPSTLVVADPSLKDNEIHGRGFWPGDRVYYEFQKDCCDIVVASTSDQVSVLWNKAPPDLQIQTTQVEDIKRLGIDGRAYRVRSARRWWR